jgi:hypothetical protein
VLDERLREARDVVGRVPDRELAVDDDVAGVGQAYGGAGELGVAYAEGVLE